MSIISLVQARLSSSRLPGKVLLPLGGTSVLGEVVARIERISDQIVVCTSTNPSDDPLEAWCRGAGLLCVRGPLDDVLSRFQLALRHPEVGPGEWFLRVTADCPLLSVELGRMLVEAASPEWDYLSVPANLLPRGLALEVVRRSTFEALDPNLLDGPEREHVTLHLYEREGRYRVRYLEPPPELHHPGLRLTVDYPEDYELIRRLFADEPEVTAERAVQRLLNEPELAAINAGCNQKPVR
jgi:spore coat polysaccharide biosynthesis protein SpsF